jgi:arylsulfatase A-like enzyme
MIVDWNAEESMTSSRRDFLKLGAPALAMSAAGQTRQRPNVLIVLTDDQGYGDFSCHGNPILKTPNMDRLHAESMRFTNFHVAPMCTPTRGQLMTGQDALRNGATSVTAGRAMVRRGIPTMADVFAAAGYSTGLFGKWHLGDNYPYRPMERGFQQAVYFRGFGLSSAPEFDNDYFNGRYQHNGETKRFDGYCTDFWFSEAMNWMDKQHREDKPFFCYLPTNAPHGPTWVDEKYAAPYRKPGVPAQFFGMIANIDENLGKLEQFLTEKGMKENTILVFMSDNGATGGFRYYNAGMRGKKTEIYDGGHRVPCFIRWPGGKLKTGVDNDTAAEVQDILPTVTELAGARLPDNAHVDGRSLAGLLRDRGPLADRMFVVQYGQIPVKWDGCTIWNNWRVIRGEELYDIKADPGQEKDLAKDHPDVLKRMKAHYEQWWSSVEPGLRDFALISLGSEKANPVALCCSDWQDIYCDNPTNVSDAIGGPQGGHWNVQIDREGTYEISLSRWPLELNAPLTSGRKPQKMTVGTLPPGKAIPIARAKLNVAGHQAEVETKPEDTKAVFRVKLAAAARTELHGWFQDASGKDVCGAFYASVRRV